MARFNEEIIKVSHPNQEMFVGAFQKGLKVGHFNESLAQKSATSMVLQLNFSTSIKSTKNVNEKTFTVRKH